MLTQLQCSETHFDWHTLTGNLNASLAVLLRHHPVNADSPVNRCMLQPMPSREFAQLKCGRWCPKQQDITTRLPGTVNFDALLTL